MRKIISLFVITIIFFTLHANSQTLSPSVISSSGGFYTSSNAMLSFTVAEMTMVQTFTAATGSILTQGFEQPELNSVGINEQELVSGDIIAYPNPTAGAFSLQYSANEDAVKTIIVYNSLGQIVIQQNYHQTNGLNKVDFNISHCSPGMYMVEFNLKNSSAESTPIFRKINLIY